MKRFLPWTGCAVAALLLVGGCQTPPPPPADFSADTFTRRPRSEADDLLRGISELSLEQAQKIAIANNPTYIAAYHAIAAAKMRYYQALGAYAPEINSSFSLSNNNNWVHHQINGDASRRSDTFSTNTAVSANWLIFDGLSREFALKIAETEYHQQKALSEDECRLLIRGVAYAYNSVLLAAENMRIAREDMDFQMKNLRVTELKQQAGAVPLSDVLNFRVLANVAEGNQITAEYQYEVALYALAVLMGYPEGTLPPSVKFPRIQDIYLYDLPSVDIYLDNALANRPDLRAYREQLQIARYQLYQTYSSFSPTVSLFAEYDYGTNRSRAYHESGKGGQNASNFSYGVGANWTLFNGFIRYNKVREAQANLSATQYQVVNTWLTVVQEVRNAYINYVQNVKQARLYEKTLEITTKQRNLVDDEYRAGNTELTRLNEAQRDLVDAQTTLASAYINVQNAKAQLDAAAAINVAEYDLSPGALSTEYIEATGIEARTAIRKEVPEIPVKPAKVHDKFPSSEPGDQVR